jgi:hypothetical protein
LNRATGCKLKIRVSGHKPKADEGIIEASLLDRARPQQSDDRLVRFVAGIKAAAPDRTLQQIAAQLETMRNAHHEAERDDIPLRSSICWPAPSVSAWPEPRR